MNNIARLEISISGRVQGVFFRVSAKEVAQQHNLTGYTKNNDDGSVEIVAEGARTDLQHLLEWSYRGSLLARVDGLSFHWKKPTGDFDTFMVQFEKTFIKDKTKALKNLTKRALKRFDKKVPKHLVIIPDGNRRWANERGLNPWDGHQKGVEQIEHLMREAKELGVTHMTFWGFSTENWKRNTLEVDWLMNTFSQYLNTMYDSLCDQEIRFHHFGRKDRLPLSLQKTIETLEEKTKHFSKYHVALALDYGGRDELVRALETLQQQGAHFSEESISQALDTKEFPDVDLIIRTSGEQRTSGMMPWQSVYAEYYFSPVCFPDFSAAELRAAIDDFSYRKRRFGGA